MSAETDREKAFRYLLAIRELKRKLHHMTTQRDNLRGIVTEVCRITKRDTNKESVPMAVQRCADAYFGNEK